MVSLFDEEATAENILTHMEKFSALAGPNDAFVFYFSGDGSVLPSEDSMRPEGAIIFATYDIDLQGPPSGTVLDDGAVERAMEKILARDKLIITDGCHLAPWPHSECRFLSGCRRNESSIEMVTPAGVHRGAFTYALEQALIALGNAPVRNLLKRIESDLRALDFLKTQTPQYVGPYSRLIMDTSDPTLRVIDLAERRAPEHFSTADLELFAGWSRKNSSLDMTPIRLALGRSLLAKDRPQDAVAVLEDTPSSESPLLLVLAKLQLGRHEDALAIWAAQAEARSGSGAEMKATLDGLRGNRCRALLVGANRGQGQMGWDSDLMPLLLRVRNALVSCCGFNQEDVNVLLDPAKDEILAAFAQLGDKQGEGPVFFLFVGPGSAGTDIWIMSRDARESGRADLSMSEIGGAVSPQMRLTAAVFLTERCGLPTASRRAYRRPLLQLQAPRVSVGRSRLLAPVGSGFRGWRSFSFLQTYRN